jgi:hypothetical protein
VPRKGVRFPFEALRAVIRNSDHPNSLVGSIPEPEYRSSS